MWKWEIANILEKAKSTENFGTWGGGVVDLMVAFDLKVLGVIYNSNMIDRLIVEWNRLKFFDLGALIENVWGTLGLIVVKVILGYSVYGTCSKIFLLLKHGCP